MEMDEIYNFQLCAAYYSFLTFERVVVWWAELGQFFFLGRSSLKTDQTAEATRRRPSPLAAGRSNSPSPVPPRRRPNHDQARNAALIQPHPLPPSLFPLFPLFPLSSNRALTRDGFRNAERSGSSE